MSKGLPVFVMRASRGTRAYVMRVARYSCRYLD
jgi:hypothetical protein